MPIVAIDFFGPFINSMKFQTIIICMKDLIDFMIIYVFQGRVYLKSPLDY